MSKNTPIVTFEEWLTSAMDMSGKGISSDETYPLSTYNPISKEYIDMLQSHYDIHKDTLSSYSKVLESLRKILPKIDEALSKPLRFNERYPDRNYFEQTVANATQLHFNDLEVYPGITYHMMDDEQINAIKTEYDRQHQANNYYFEKDLDTFADKIKDANEIPYNLQYTLYYDAENDTLTIN